MVVPTEECRAAHNIPRVLGAGARTAAGQVQAANVAHAGDVMTPRPRQTIVLCGPESGHTDGVAALLAGDGWIVTRCTGEESLLAIICEHRPRGIVYALAHQIAVDLALLSLLGQVAPDLPVVVVASAEHGLPAGDFEGARPVVLEQAPADGVRLRHALRTALRRPRRREPRLVASTG